MTDGPWTKYAAPPAEGPWSKYAPPKVAKEDTPPVDSGPPVALADEPGKEYGTILPFSRDIKTGKTALAFPEIIRGPVQAASRATQEMFGQRPLPQPKESLEQAALGIGAPVAKEAGKLAPEALQAGKDVLTGKAARTIEETAQSLKAEASAEKIAHLTPQAQAAHAAGFTLPPHLATEKPGSFANIAGGFGGAQRLEQGASKRNQPVVNSIAARELGLPEGTELTPEVFDKVRADAGKAYEAVKQAVPAVDIGSDKQYLRDIRDIGGPSAALDRYFPNTSKNPAIDEMKAELAGIKEVPTPVLVEKIKQLRFQASQNFKALGDPSKFALGLSQREAADAIEDAVERGVTNADQYFGKKFAQAGKDEAAALKDVQKANRAVTAAVGKLSGTSNVYVVNQGLKAQHEASMALQKALSRLDRVRAAKADIKSRLAAAQDNTTRDQLVNEYKAARVRIAKAHDLEAATNPATGDVNAVKLGALLRKGKPLTEGMKTLAESALAFPKAFQDKARFGGDKPLTVLDVVAMLEALGHGNLPLAGAVATRPLSRSVLLSKPYQKRMISPQLDRALSSVPTPQE